MFTSDGSAGAGGNTPPAAGMDDAAVAQVVAAVDALAGENPAGLGWTGQRERLRAVGRLLAARGRPPRQPPTTN